MTDLAKRIRQAAELAQPIYVAHGWTWGWPEDQREIPSVDRIADTIKRLYDNVTTIEGCNSSSTGRLFVSVDEDDGSISVEVQLAELRGEIPGWIVPGKEEA